MFFLKNRNIAIFLSIAALMLWANVGMTQTEWEKYPGNPVLDLGESGTWDDYYVHSLTILFDGTKYQMWYTGDDDSSTRHKIGYATSADGIVWVKYPENPVLDPGASGTWDDYAVSDPTILFDGTSYQMWYNGYDGSNFRIGYATSSDGILWNKHLDNPVLDVGANGTWDDYYVHGPTVLFDGTVYQMWYAGYDGSNYRIGYATSSDGILWNKHPDNPVWTEFDAIKRDNFAPEREPIFHYCIFAHNYSGGTSSGLSRGIPASDFIVSLGSWPEQVGTPMQQAGTFMHELGHNIGLRHGGADHVNYKPNYLSIMSYFFQMSGLLRKGRFGELDYSKFLIEDLDENHLNETKGLDAVGGDDPIKAYGTQYYCPSGKVETVKRARRFVDWNCNGRRINRNVAVDLNNDDALDTLTGHYNDWDNLIFDGGSIGPTFRISEVPEVFEELTLEEYLRINPVLLEE